MGSMPEPPPPCQRWEQRETEVNGNRGDGGNGKTQRNGETEAQTCTRNLRFSVPLCLTVYSLTSVTGLLRDLRYRLLRDLRVCRLITDGRAFERYQSPPRSRARSALTFRTECRRR